MGFHLPTNSFSMAFFPVLEERYETDGVEVLLDLLILALLDQLVVLVRDDFVDALAESPENYPFWRIWKASGNLFMGIRGLRHVVSLNCGRSWSGDL